MALFDFLRGRFGKRDAESPTVASGGVGADEEGEPSGGDEGGAESSSAEGGADGGAGDGGGAGAGG